MRFEISTDAKTTVRDVTDEVRAAIPADHDGTVTVFVRHTTAGVVVNEAEPRLLSDVERFVADLAPDEGWRHDDLDVRKSRSDFRANQNASRSDAGNADSHLRALLLGQHVTVPVSDGDLDLGRWQSVLFVECDGPRTRTVEVVA